MEEQEKNGQPTRLKFITVVGKMRSGTSAVSEALHMMGCSMGQWFVAPQPPSWRSDWEDADFNRLTFSRMPFGSTDVPMRGEQLQMRVDGLYAEYLLKRRQHWQTIKQVRALEYPVIGVKHPFLLFVLDEWKETLRRNGFENYTVCIRRPEWMVKKSAKYTIDKKKGGKETQEALGKYINRYNYDLTVDYEILVSKPEKVVRQLAELAGISEEEDIQRAIRSVKKPSKYNLVEQEA
jgi:hypothetical protein